MVSEGIDKGMNRPITFHDVSTRAFNLGRKTLSVSGTPSGFVDQKLFGADRQRYFLSQGDFRQDTFEDGRRNVDVPGDRKLDEQKWRSRDVSDREEEEDDDGDDEEDEEDEDDECATAVGRNGGGKESNSNGNNSNSNSTAGIGSNNSSGGVHSISNKIRGGNLERENGGNKGNSDEHHPFVGMSSGALIKDPAIDSSNMRGNLDECPSSGLNECSSTRYNTAVTVAESENYYPHNLQGPVPSIGHSEPGGENGCGFSGRKYTSLSREPHDSLKAILSDPIIGVLMEDAVILACGHSHHVLKMQACSTCGHSISADFIAPNLSLRTAVQAFRREEEMQLSKTSKRRRGKFEQEKGSFGDLVLVDGSRNRGVQFPFAVGDSVIIQGNKRTPQRFVGREATVTTQCLNGWYVVKTLDNAESVKLQYRSLSKVGTCALSSGMLMKTGGPAWL